MHMRKEMKRTVGSRLCSNLLTPLCSCVIYSSIKCYSCCLHFFNYIFLLGYQVFSFTSGFCGDWFANTNLIKSIF